MEHFPPRATAKPPEQTHGSREGCNNSRFAVPSGLVIGDAVRPHRCLQAALQPIIVLVRRLICHLKRLSLAFQHGLKKLYREINLEMWPALVNIVPISRDCQTDLRLFAENHRGMTRSNVGPLETTDNQRASLTRIS